MSRFLLVIAMAWCSRVVVGDATAEAEAIQITEGAYKRAPVNENDMWSSGSDRWPQFVELREGRSDQQRINDKFIADIPQEYQTVISQAKRGRDIGEIGTATAGRAFHDLMLGGFGFLDENGKLQVVKSQNALPDSTLNEEQNQFASEYQKQSKHPRIHNPITSTRTSSTSTSDDAFQVPPTGATTTTTGSPPFIQAPLHQFTTPRPDYEASRKTLIRSKKFRQGISEDDKPLPPFGPPYHDADIIANQVENEGLVAEEEPLKHQIEVEAKSFDEPVVLNTHHTLVPFGQDQFAFEPSQPDFGPLVDAISSSLQGTNDRVKDDPEPTFRPVIINDPHVHSFTQDQYSSVARSVEEQDDSEAAPFIGPLNKGEDEHERLTKLLSDFEEEGERKKAGTKDSKRFNEIFNKERVLASTPGSVGFQKFSMHGVDVAFDIMGHDDKDADDDAGADEASVKRPKTRKHRRRPKIRRNNKNRRRNKKTNRNRKRLDIRGSKHTRKNDLESAEKIPDDQAESKENIRPERDFPHHHDHFHIHHDTVDKFPTGLIHDHTPQLPHILPTKDPLHVNVRIDPRQKENTDLPFPPYISDVRLLDILHGPGLKSLPGYYTATPPHHQHGGEPLVHHPNYHGITPSPYPPHRHPHIPTPTPLPHVVHLSEPPKHRKLPHSLHDQVLHGPTVSTLPPRIRDEHTYYHNDEARDNIQPITKAPYSSYGYLLTTNHPEEVSTLPPRPTNHFVATTTLPPRKYGKYVTPSIVLNTIISSTDPSELPNFTDRPLVVHEEDNEVQPSTTQVSRPIAKPHHDNREYKGVERPLSLAKSKDLLHNGKRKRHKHHLSQEALKKIFEKSKPYKDVVRQLPIKKKYVHHPTKEHYGPVFKPHRPGVHFPSPEDKEFKVKEHHQPLYRPTTAKPTNKREIDSDKDTPLTKHPFGPSPKPLSLKPKAVSHGLQPLPPKAVPVLEEGDVRNVVRVVEFPEHGGLVEIQEDDPQQVVRRVVLPTRIKSGDLFEEGQIIFPTSDEKDKEPEEEKPDSEPVKENDDADRYSWRSFSDDSAEGKIRFDEGFFASAEKAVFPDFPFHFRLDENGFTPDSGRDYREIVQPRNKESPDLKEEKGVSADGESKLATLNVHHLPELEVQEIKLPEPRLDGDGQDAPSPATTKKPNLPQKTHLGYKLHSKPTDVPVVEFVPSPKEFSGGRAGEDDEDGFFDTGFFASSDDFGGAETAVENPEDEMLSEGSSHTPKQIVAPLRQIIAPPSIETLKRRFENLELMKLPEFRKS